MRRMRGPPSSRSCGTMAWQGRMKDEEDEEEEENEDEGGMGMVFGEQLH